MKPYTVFCRDQDGTGTMWIDIVQADDPFKAAELGKRQCAEDWGLTGDDDWESHIAIQGVLRGDVTVEFWND